LKRSRTGEDNIPLDYLTSCHEYHKTMIQNITPMFERKQDDVIILDGNVDIFSQPEELANWIEKITYFIYNLK